jgi:hypothetical protein
MECPGRDLPKHPMPGSWGRPRQGRLERSARHEGSPAGIRFPGGVMMLFVFSWPATTRPSCALRCGIETQWAVRRRLTEPPPKSPGTVAGESAAGEETATMLRRHFGQGRAKCILIGSNSTTGHLGGVRANGVVERDFPLTLSGIDPLLLTKPDPPSRHGCARENAAHTAIPERTRLYTASRVRCAGLQKPQPTLDPAPRRKAGCWRAPTVGQFS